MLMMMMTHLFLSPFSPSPIADRPINGLGYIWTALRRVFPMEVTEEIRGMQLRADDLGAVFDVPSKYMAQIREVMNDNTWLSIATELPKVKERLNQGNGGFSMGGRGGGGLVAVVVVAVVGEVSPLDVVAVGEASVVVVVVGVDSVVGEEEGVVVGDDSESLF